MSWPLTVLFVLSLLLGALLGWFVVQTSDWWNR